MGNSLSFVVNVLENLPIGCVILDSDGKIISANGCMASYFNSCCADYKGKKLGDVFNCLVVSGNGEPFKPLADCTFADIRNGIECVRNHNGADRWLQISTNVVNIDENEYIVASVLDTSASKELDQMIKAGDEKYNF